MNVNGFSKIPQQWTTQLDEDKGRLCKPRQNGYECLIKNRK